VVTATTWLRFDRAIRPFHDQPPSNCGRIAVETHSRFVVVTAGEATAIDIRDFQILWENCLHEIARIRTLAFCDNNMPPHAHAASRRTSKAARICCMNRRKTVCVSLSRCTHNARSRTMHFCTEVSAHSGSCLPWSKRRHRAEARETISGYRLP